MSGFNLRGAITLLGLIAFGTCVCSAQQSTTSAGKPLRRVEIVNSEVRNLKSTETGRDYDIYIRVPDNYAAEAGKKYPVLYIIDGQWDFKLLDSVYGGLYYDKFVPEMILVGITYAGENPNFDRLRAMDLTPVPNNQFPGSGDAPKFLTFLKKDLMPYIESNYRIDAAKRTLMGSSFGGLFTVYTMFADPGLFRGYVAASPAVPYGDGFAFKQEKEFADKHTDISARLFLSVGSVEQLAGPVQAYMKALGSRGYKGLKLETRVIEGERHAGNKPEAFNRGLRFIFQGDDPK